MTKLTIDELNKMTWEELNPDWQECGDLTGRMALSELDMCPACGTVDNIKIQVVGEDYEVSVGCVPCSFYTVGMTPSDATDKWNARDTSERDRLTAELADATATLHKQSGMANEINILTKENRQLRDQLAEAREQITSIKERLDNILHTTPIGELWDAVTVFKNEL